MGKFMMLIIALALSTTGWSQTLFSYGTKNVSKDEFLYSFHKNNADTGSRTTAIKDYLDLYVRFKLKVQAAHDAKLDTLKNLKNELASFKEQIAPLHMVDKKTMDFLTAEAHQRAQSDLELQYIFIAYRNDTSSKIKLPITEKEILDANAKALNVKARLAKGERFENIATQFSDGPDAQTNKGYLGYITVFSLPYAFENEVYNLTAQQVSQPLKNTDGIYFFKLLNKRKSIGKITAQHILIALPDQTTPDEIAKRKALAEELYLQLENGISFDTLAKKFSDDKSSNTHGGMLSEIGIGMYEPSFENALFALKKDGDISPVCQTSFGFHILKRISLTPIETNLQKADASLRDQILQNDRKMIASKAFEDSSLIKAAAKKINTKEKDFLLKHLDQFSDEFNLQVNDFRDGNLLFEIMDRKVWNKSTNDIEGLKKFHASKKSNYTWNHSVYAWIITASGKEMAEKMIKEYKTSHSLWQLKTAYSDVALIDSGRYEASELINVGEQNANEGYISEININQVDGSASFVIVVKKFNDPTIKSFNEAKGSVVNDYQKFLEDNWIDSLKKKYPVVINQKILEQILNPPN